jgi:hypothetical protein
VTKPKSIVIYAVVGLALLGGSAVVLSQEAPSDLLKTADAIVAQVTRLRGLAPKNPIQKGVKSRAEISAYLNSHVKENYGEQQLETEGRMLKALGLIPEPSKYKELVMKLLTEQVGGYYDPDKKTFFIAGWLPLEQQRPVMVHELTHALQDQYFDLNNVLKKDLKDEDDDRTLAHQAIFEGDAMAVMLDSLLEPMGRNFSQLPDLVTAMRSQFAMMDSQFEVFKSAPVYLKETLLFPYSYGASFLQKVRATQPWSAVDRIYSDLPQSTEQIMHPDKYLGTRDEPQTLSPADPAGDLGGPWKTTYHNVLGEFTVYLLLRSQLQEDQARTAAAGWDGDVIQLVENGAGKSAAFLTTVWDTPEDADEFQAAARDLLKARHPQAQAAKNLPDVLTLVDGGEYSAVEKNGSTVRLILRLPEAEAAKIKGF